MSIHIQRAIDGRFFSPQAFAGPIVAVGLLRPLLVSCALAAISPAAATLAMLTIASASTSAAWAETPEEARRKLEANRRVLDETRQREQGLQRDVEVLEVEGNKINRNLIDTAKAAQRAEAKMTQIENRLGELDALDKLERGSLAQNHGKIAKLLAAMQRMGRNPPPVMVTRREDALEMVRSAMLLAAVFPELKEQALTLSTKLNEIARLLDEKRQEGEQLRTETSRLADARSKLDNLIAQKRENITERQGELRQVRQAATELAQSVTELNELIVRLDKTVSDTVGISEYNRELGKNGAAGEERAAAAGPQAAPAEPGAREPRVPEPRVPEPRVPEQRAKAGDRMAEKNDRVAIATPGPGVPPPGGPMVAPKPARPSVPFEQMKGVLGLPAAGKRVVGYGERTEVGATTSKGIVIETRVGAQITSPSDGWVVYAGEFRTYGQLLIINGGGGYHIVLAGLTRIDVVVGQFVLAGEPIGAMGATGTGTGAAALEGRTAKAGAGGTGSGKVQDPPPVLYVEFRKDGRPFDSGPWWAPDGGKRVQG